MTWRGWFMALGVMAWSGVAWGDGACPDGQVPLAEHCCWPGQGWSQTRGACIGLARCPPGYVPSGSGCVSDVECPVGQKWNGTACVVKSTPAPSAASARSAVEVDVAAFNPVLGPSAALVTLVEWADFQCPFSSRAEATLSQIRETYGDKVRLVWRNQPLPFHTHAAAAARAAMAANAQGKFWQLHDALFANQQRLEDADIEGYASGLGLDMRRWRFNRDSSRIQDEIDQDARYGKTVDANGTPTFFINGIRVVGAQPFAKFADIIDDQIKLANDLKAKGVRPSDLYSKLVSLNVAAAPPASSPSTLAPDADAVVKVDPGNSPSRGPSDAKVTIVQFSDFQCPFCSRAYKTMNELERAYQGRVRMVFKQNPLPFHPNAEPAAEAALAAGEQGKFWEMYDQLFTNQSHLTRADLDGYASAIGLDMGRFTDAMDSGKFRDQVQAELKQGQAAGIAGTPSFVINGHKVVGAQPIEAFEKVIDAELAR
jgi:protein-disulfide isomerase